MKDKTRMVDAGNHIGLKLKTLRLERNLSLKDVASETCVSRVYIAAIESADYDAMPALTFSIGFVKSYANCLGFPASQAVNSFRNEWANHFADSETDEDQICDNQITGKLTTGKSKTTTLSRTMPSLPVSNTNRMQHMTVSIALFGIALTLTAFGGGHYETTETAVSAVVVNAGDSVGRQTSERRAGPNAPDTNANEIVPSQSQPAEKFAFDNKGLLSTDRPERLQIKAQDKRQDNTMSRPIKSSLFPSAQASETVDPVITASTRIVTALEDNWLQLLNAQGQVVWQGVLVAGQKKILDPGVVHLTTGNAGGLSYHIGEKSFGSLGQRGQMFTAMDLDTFGQ